MTKSLPHHIEVIFKGKLPNKQVFDFYEKTPVTLFLNVSRSEGIPVSIMEAISYGIPVVATNVGEVREIVNDKTGHLLDVNFDCKYAANLIEKNLALYSNFEFRKDVKAFWHDNFNATKNYVEFIQDVLLNKKN